MTDTQGNSPPIKTFRAGQIEAAIWPQEKEQDGRTYVQHSVRIQKRYRDKDGNWQATEYFFPNELPIFPWWLTKPSSSSVSRSPTTKTVTRRADPV